MNLLAGALLSAYILFFAVDILVFSRRPPLLHPLPEAEAAAANAPLVSIIVPARNCERTVSACVESLLALDYPGKEVIVVEGGSSDGTREALEPYAERVKIVAEPPLPPGWVGKNWACHQGYLSASGEYLLFTDADTFHSKSSLRSAVSLATGEGMGLLSLSTAAELRTVPERAVLPLVFSLVLGLARMLKVNDDSSKFAWAVGSYLLVSRRAYQAAGGHEGVRRKIDEDVMLAIRAKKAGMKARMLDGSAFVRTWMYDSVASMVRGLVRNFYGVARRSWGNEAELATAALLRYLLPFVALAYGASALAAGQGWALLLLGSAAALLACADHYLLLRKLGVRAGYAVALPASGVLVVAILAAASLRAAAGLGVTWRGRKYSHG